MAQSGFTPISTYYTTTASAAPTAGNLVNGELAINITDGKLFYKDNAGVVQTIASKNGVAGGSTTQVQYNSSGSLAGSANMTFSGTALTLANDASISGLTVGKGGGAVSSNTAFGITALNGNTSGVQNTAVGYTALFSKTTGDQNTAIGNRNSYSTTTASYNTSVGGDALYSNTTGANNVALGFASLNANTTASNNTAVGYQAGYSQSGASPSITAVGYQALYGNTTGTNDAFGYQSLKTNSTGDSNSAFGFQTLQANTTGGSNVAMGLRPLYSNTTGGSNIAIGREALYSNTTASNNTAVGYQAGYSLTTGGNNVLMGYYGGIGGAGSGLTTATANTFIGPSAGYLVTTGSKNTFLGAFSGNSGSLDLRTASNYIVLSDGDGNPRLVSDNTGNILINTTSSFDGNLCVVGNTGADVVGVKSVGGATAVPLVAWNSATTGNNVFVGFYTEASLTSRGNITYNRVGGLVSYNTTSDQRLKENITDAGSALEKIGSVKIRSFDWKETGNHTDFGVIAQELITVAPEAVTAGDEEAEIKQTWGVDTSALVPAMIKAIQELKAQVNAQAVEIASLKAK